MLIKKKKIPSAFSIEIGTAVSGDKKLMLV